MVISVPRIPFSTLLPDVDQAFAEWKTYKQDRSCRKDGDQLGVVTLAKRVLGLSEDLLTGAAKVDPLPLPIESQALLYKVFSRASSVHFALDEKLFSPEERLSIVGLLYTLTPTQAVDVRKRQMTLLRRMHSEIVVNRLAWNLLLGIHFEEILLNGGNTDPLQFDYGDGNIDAEALLHRLSQSLSVQKVPDGQGGDLICLKSPRELLLFFIYMENRGNAIAWCQEISDGRIPWWPFDRGEYEKEHTAGTHIFTIASSPIEGQLLQDPIWSAAACPFVVVLPLKVFLELYQQRTPAGLCVQAAICARRLVLEDDFSDFETYLCLLQSISDPKIWGALSAKNVIFEIFGKDLFLRLNGIEKFSTLDGPLNRALMEAGTAAIAEVEHIQKEPSQRALDSFQCVSLTRQLIRILAPFLENPSLECPLLLAKDSFRLCALIESAVTIDGCSKVPLFTDFERDRIRKILCRFCSEGILDETQCVHIESHNGFVLVHTLLVKLFFREYSKGVCQLRKMERIQTDGLLQDGLELVSTYFRLGKDLFLPTGRQALQLVTFFDRMMSTTFCGREALIEIIYSQQKALCIDPEVVGSSALVGTLLTLLSDRVQKRAGYFSKTKERQGKKDFFPLMGRHALQLVAFSDQKSCSFYGKGSLIEIIYSRQVELCEDPEVFGNPVLVKTLLMLLSDKVEEIDGYFVNQKEIRDKIVSLFRKAFP